MSRLTILNKIKVKSALVLILLFFILALIAGAALGVLSLKQNNTALQQIVQHQAAVDALNLAVDEYKDSQVLLSRAVVSHVQNNARVTHITTDDNTRHLLGQVQIKLNASMANFSEYQQLMSHAPKLQSGYAYLKASYDELIKDGIDPLIEFLKKGQITEFNTHLNLRTKTMEQKLYADAMQLNWLQQDIIYTHVQRQENQYELVLQLVALGMILTLLLAVGAYLFLHRVVLLPLNRIGAHFEKITQGDLTQTINTESTNEIGVLFLGLSRMQTSLHSMVLTVRQGVKQILSDSNEIHLGTIDLDQRSAQQAMALQQTAASMEQLASTVRQNTENASQANQVTKSSSKIAHQSGEEVSSVVNTMAAISSSADKISEIVNVIDSIAFQTNILALNAAVEAARAGEQGRGFAVVAAEVRALAQRSANAAHEIKELILNSLEQINQGSVQANKTGAVVLEVVTAVNNITALMSEIAQSSSEQSLGIDQVNSAVIELDGVVQMNNQLAQQAMSSAHSLQRHAERLAQEVAMFEIHESSEAQAADDHVDDRDSSYALSKPIYITER